MIFADKPKKAQSKLAKDKRTLSLLNMDYKTLTGIEAARHNAVLDHTVSAHQFAVGNSKRIHHAIRMARDAIFAAGKAKHGCGIADLDFMAAFNNLCMDWVEMVLVKKGLHSKAVARIRRLYTDGVTIPVINSQQGQPIKNSRRTLRQGDCPSSVWFAYGIDPLLEYLDKRLKGINIFSTPVQGPALINQPRLLPPLDLKYVIVGYCDDVKPAITSMEEFLTVDRAARLFEELSGCKLQIAILALTNTSFSR